MGVAEHNGVRSNFYKTSGKWYWEITINSGTTHFVGIGTGDAGLNEFVGSDEFGYSYHSLDGKAYSNAASLVYGDTYIAGDVIGVALDLDDNKIWFSKNGVWQNSGDPAAGTAQAFSLPDDAFYAMWSGYDASEVTANFGATAFAYTAPSGFTIPTDLTQTEWSWDPDLVTEDYITLSDDNLKASPKFAGGPYYTVGIGRTVNTELQKLSGKYYIELLYSHVLLSTTTTFGSQPPYSSQVGEIGVAKTDLAQLGYCGASDSAYVYSASGLKRTAGAGFVFGDVWADGDILGIAIDLDNLKVWFSKNGVWQGEGNPSTGINPAFTLPENYAWRIVATIDHNYEYGGQASGGVGLAWIFKSYISTIHLTAGHYDSPLDFGVIIDGISETTTLSDDITASLEIGDVAATYDVTISEGFTTDDWEYGELPGDTEDVTSGHIGESFTTADAIDAETPYCDLDEDVELSDAIDVEAPYRDVGEQTTLSDGISATIDPWYASIAEDVTTGDHIEAPMEVDNDEDVTTADGILVFKEVSKTISETTTTSEQITGERYKEQIIAQSLGAYDDVAVSWGKTVESSAAIVDTVTAQTGIEIHDWLAASDTLLTTWHGTETLSETLMAFGLSIQQKLCQDSLDSSAAIADTVGLELSILVREYLAVLDTVTSNYTGTMTIVEALHAVGNAIAQRLYQDSLESTALAVDVVTAGYLVRAIVASAGLIADTITDSYIANPAIAEALAAVDAITDNYMPSPTVQETFHMAATVLGTPHFNQIVAEEWTIADTIAFAWDNTVTDSLSVVDSLVLQWTAIEALTSALVAADTVSGSLYINDAVAEALALADAVLVGQILGLVIADALNIGDTIKLDGEVWECWVLNGNQFNPSIYSGFEFNSYATYNNAAYGCKDDGIYELTGATDAGTAIKAGIVLPETYFGIQATKRFRKGYFGLTNTGTPLIRLETESGNQTYTISDSRANFSRSQYGKEWTVKLGDFEVLSFIELVPIILTR